MTGTEIKLEVQKFVLYLSVASSVDVVYICIEYMYVSEINAECLNSWSDDLFIYSSANALSWQKSNM